MDQKRGGGQMSGDEEWPKGASFIAWPGGEQVARRKMAQKGYTTGKGPTFVKRRETEDV